MSTCAGDRWYTISCLAIGVKRPARRNGNGLLNPYLKTVISLLQHIKPRTDKQVAKAKQHLSELNSRRVAQQFGTISESLGKGILHKGKKCYTTTTCHLLPSHPTNATLCSKTNSLLFNPHSTHSDHRGDPRTSSSSCPHPHLPLLDHYPYHSPPHPQSRKPTLKPLAQSVRARSHA